MTVVVLVAVSLTVAALAVIGWWALRDLEAIAGRRHDDEDSEGIQPVLVPRLRLVGPSPAA